MSAVVVPVPDAFIGIRRVNLRDRVTGRAQFGGERLQAIQSETRCATDRF